MDFEDFDEYMRQEEEDRLERERFEKELEEEERSGREVMAQEESGVEGGEHEKETPLEAQSMNSHSLGHDPKRLHESRRARLDQKRTMMRKKVEERRLEAKDYPPHRYAEVNEIELESPASSSVGADSGTSQETTFTDKFEGWCEEVKRDDPGACLLKLDAKRSSSSFYMHDVYECGLEDSHEEEILNPLFNSTTSMGVPLMLPRPQHKQEQRGQHQRRDSNLLKREQNNHCINVADGVSDKIDSIERELKTTRKDFDEKTAQLSQEMKTFKDSLTDREKTIEATAKMLFELQQKQLADENRSLLASNNVALTLSRCTSTADLIIAVEKSTQTECCNVSEKLTISDEENSWTSANMEKDPLLSISISPLAELRKKRQWLPSPFPIDAHSDESTQRARFLCTPIKNAPVDDRFGSEAISDVFYWELHYNEYCSMYDSDVFLFASHKWRLNMFRNKDGTFGFTLNLLTSNRAPVELYCDFKAHKLLREPYSKDAILTFGANRTNFTRNSAYKGFKRFVGPELLSYVDDENVITLSVSLSTLLTNGCLRSPPCIPPS